MTNQPEPHEFDSAQDLETDDGMGGALTAVMETPVDAPNPEGQPPKDPCPNCEHDRDPNFPMCRVCGFYERLNTFVDISDEQLEGELGQSSGAQMPTWAYVLMGVVSFLIIESIAVTFIYPLNSVPRMTWSLVQLFLGVVIALTAHCRAAFMTIMEHSDTELGDIIMRPTKIWAPVIAKLPKSLIWVTGGVGGFVAVIMSVAVIRSIPYNLLFKTDAPPAKQRRTLEKAINEAKKAAQADQEMEEALHDFKKKALGEEKEQEVIREKVECVIVGYHAPDDQPDAISSIVVAGPEKRKLVIYGIIGQGFSEDDIKLFAKRFKKIGRDTCFIPTKRKAKWVQPVLRCMVSFKTNKTKQRIDMRFEKLTGTVNLLK